MSDETQGCSHREHQWTQPCNKLCNPGHHLCPYHELLADAAADRKEKRRKEHEAELQRQKVKSRRR
jgi:hypothetical protein